MTDQPVPPTADTILDYPFTPDDIDKLIARARAAVEPPEDGWEWPAMVDTGLLDLIGSLADALEAVAKAATP